MRTVNYKGVPFEIRDGEPGDWDQSIIHSVFDQDEYKIFDLINSPIRRVVDLGAHIGSFTRLVQFWFPQAEIISVEPIPGNFKLLKKNTLQNGLCRLLELAAVGSATNNLRLWCNEPNTGSWQLAELASLVVPSKPLLEIIEPWYEVGIDLIKMDIEGFEVELLQSLVPTGWLRKINFIHGEWHGRNAYRQIPVLLGNTHYVWMGNNHPHLGLFRAWRK